MATTKGRRRNTPLVAIVGRPNVGKSTLFNRIAGVDKSIVESTPGVTRDRVYADVKWKGKGFSLVDTAGLEPPGSGDEPGAREQAEVAIEEADLILMLLSATDAFLPQDGEILRALRKSGKKVLCVVNKVDHKKHEGLVDNFHSLGEVESIGVSALHGRNVYELVDRIVSEIPVSEPCPPEEGEPAIRLAILGKPNVGKSTLVNTILKSERMVTSPVAGTTRDAVDVEFEYGGRKYVMTDTAGVRKRARVGAGVERLATLKAIRSIAECDVAILMIEAAEGPSRQDTRLASLIEDRGKAAVIALNKWDLAPEGIEEEAGDIEQKAVRGLGGALHFAPVVKISALRGDSIRSLFAAVRKAVAQRGARVSTRKLNDFLKKTVDRGPSVLRGREFKAYYMSQVGERPPGFVIFTNSSGAIPVHYSRYFERRLREEFGFEGTPVRLFFRKRKDPHTSAASSKTD